MFFFLGFLTRNRQFRGRFFLFILPLLGMVFFLFGLFFVKIFRFRIFNYINSNIRLILEKEYLICSLQDYTRFYSFLKALELVGALLTKFELQLNISSVHVFQIHDEVPSLPLLQSCLALLFLYFLIKISIAYEPEFWLLAILPKINSLL